MSRFLTALVLVAVAGAALLGAFAGCGSGTKTVTETISSETTTTIEGSATPSATSEPTSVHAKSGGIEVAVKRAYTKPTVSYEGGTISSFSPNGEPKTVKAPQGGSYIYVAATVKNETSEGLDLTCGYPMEVKLVDASGRRFDSVENLDLLKGNPECNVQLQPGFDDEMTWVFLVPSDAEITALRFAQVTADLKDKPPVEIFLPSL